MKLLIARMWAIVLAVLFVATAAAASVSQIPSVSKPDVEPMATGPTPRTVLMEMFTGTWCTWCGVIKPAISRMLDEFGPDRLLMLAYHNADVFEDLALDTARRDFYRQPTLTGWPTTIIDGGGYTTGSSLYIRGSYGSPNPPGMSSQDYDAFKAKVQGELLPSKYTNMEVSLTGDLTPGAASVTAVVTSTDIVTELALKMRFALYEDALYATQVNGPPVHRYVIRQLVEIPFSMGYPETLTFTRTFSPNPAWDLNRMGVIGFVQDDAMRGWACTGGTCYNSPVIQAARYHFVTPNTLYVRDDDVTDMNSPPTRGEYMETVLSDADRPHEVWNILDPMDTGTNDVRGAPNLAKMEEYGTVIWSTGSAMGILDAANVADLSSYLDGFGNLWIHGEEVATDLAASQPTFLTNYLHAAHGTDPVSPPYMNGVAGDPITGAWSATQLLFAGLSPDNVDPDVGGITMLYYPGTNSAGVRADHDLDSRVVTMGQNYFQGTDALTRRTTMVNNALDWFDGIAGPKVTVVTPNGGEQYSPGEVATIRWKAVDVEIPINAVDIYFTDTLSSPVWSPVDWDQPNDGVYVWTVPAVQTADCGVKIVVRDGDLTTRDGEAVSAAPCLIGSPDVSITKDVSNPTPQIGQSITYTITLTNAGPVTGYATVTDALPLEVSYLTDDGDLTGVSAYFPVNRTCVWTVSVPGLSNVVWHIDVTVIGGTPGVPVTNTASFYSTDKSGGSVQTGNDNADFQIPVAESWYINLPVGKHLLSIPILLSDYRVDLVLASISGRYSYVRQYDAWDLAHPWKSYMPGRMINTLTHLNLGTGFWIEITIPANLSVTGARPVTTNVQLVTGWNMVGYPSYSTTYTIAQMKADLGLSSLRAEGFDDKSPPYNLWRLPDTYVMRAGEGYWVYVPSSCTWPVTF